MDGDGVFTLADCGRCGSPVLVGHCDGLDWRVDCEPIGVTVAEVLHEHGLTPLVLDARVGGLYGAVFDLSVHRPAPGRVLVACHVCGSAHSKRRPVVVGAVA